MKAQSHLPGVENRPSAGHRLRRWGGGLAAGVVFLLAAAAGGDTTKPARVELALKLAPPGCVGILHVDVSVVAKEVIRQLRPHKAEFATLNLDRIEALSAKIESADLLLLSRGPGTGPQQLLILRGRLGASDVEEFGRAIGKDKFAAKKVGNGRYDSTEEPAPLRVVLGNEAGDLAEGVVLVGLRDMLTDAFVKKLGTGQARPLRKLLAEVNTSAPLWGALVLPVEEAHDAPRLVWGHADPRMAGKADISLRFDNAKAAASLELSMKKEGFLFSGVFQAERKGDVVSLRPKQKEGFFGAILQSVARARRLARRAISLANLHGIGAALALYATDNNGRVPKHLGELVTSGTISMAMLISPLGSTSTKGWDAKAGKIPGDYVYLAVPASKVPADLAEKLLQVYELPELHPGEGTNVLYVDGHAGFVKLEEFKEQLKQTQAWLAGNR